MGIGDIPKLRDPQELNKEWDSTMGEAWHAVGVLEQKIEERLHAIEAELEALRATLPPAGWKLVKVPKDG